MKLMGAVINDSYTGEVKITVVATGFDAVPSETASFRRHTSLRDNEMSAPPVMKNAEDELDIPAFIRKKMN